MTPFVSLTERDEREMLDAIGVSSVDELFRDVPEGVRFRRELEAIALAGGADDPARGPGEAGQVVGLTAAGAGGQLGGEARRQRQL